MPICRVELVRWLQARGHDVVHTRDLPRGNRTGDGDINRLSIAEQRIIVTKDADFVNSFVLHRQPYKLLIVATGNSTNDDLLQLFMIYITDIETAFTTNDYIEISRTVFIIHR